MNRTTSGIEQTHNRARRAPGTGLARGRIGRFAWVYAVFSWLPAPVGAAIGGDPARLDLTGHWVGFVALALFALAYLLVVSEEFTHLRKSKPVVLAAGFIWLLIGLVYAQQGYDGVVSDTVRHVLVEYVELFLFLLAAMTYVNAMTERNVFGALRSWLVRAGFDYRTLFWVTGVISFFLSAIIDNLTTALVMSAIALAVGKGNSRFIALSCINIVVAANAGGAWCAFGDITSLMVWQAGALDFFQFFELFPASVVNWIVPAVMMYFAVPAGAPAGSSTGIEPIERGGKRVMLLFAATLCTSVSFQHFAQLPAALGMMTGLGYLQLFGYYLKRTGSTTRNGGEAGDVVPFDVFRFIARAEWDTLLFFYGVILCVGGLGFIGYLAMASQLLYVEMGPTFANVMVGVASALVDNIPIMAAVIQMTPQMSDAQWLLVTLTAGVGGSMLSIGSAAGVALMGQARGHYTFFRHLRWTPAIALGYAVSIMVHLWINA
jgi:Na+/H+ antiporter NhaD/arsenite permease-like protein